MDGFTFQREELGFQVFDVLTTSGRRHPVHVGADLGQGNTVTEEADLSPHLLHLSPQAGVVKRLVVVPFLNSKNEKKQQKTLIFVYMFIHVTGSIGKKFNMITIYIFLH